MCYEHRAQNIITRECVFNIYIKSLNILHNFTIDRCSVFDFRHNAAAGGSHFGYWYRTESHPSGPSYTTSYCPNHAPMGEFFNNTAHSFGRWVTERHVSRSTTKKNAFLAKFSQCVTTYILIHSFHPLAIGFTYIKNIGKTDAGPCPGIDG